MAKGIHRSQALKGIWGTHSPEPGARIRGGGGRSGQLIAIGVRYLCGWSASMDVSSRMRAEWPPHAGRLYMALAAAHFESGADPAERAALEWLEVQSPP